MFIIMSDKPKSKTNYTLIAGVVKFAYKKAGYPEVSKIANEWKKDECFHEIIVRFVSETSFGIQFVYYTDSEFLYEDWKVKYLDKIRDLLYAHDINTSCSSKIEEVMGDVIVSKALPTHLEKK